MVDRRESGSWVAGRTRCCGEEGGAPEAGDRQADGGERGCTTAGADDASASAAGGGSGRERGEGSGKSGGPRESSGDAGWERGPGRRCCCSCCGPCCSPSSCKRLGLPGEGGCVTVGQARVLHTAGLGGEAGASSSWQGAGRGRRPGKRAGEAGGSQRKGRAGGVWAAAAVGTAAMPPNCRGTGEGDARGGGGN